LRVITGLERFQHLQSVSLAVHSTTILRADGSHGPQARSRHSDMYLQEMPTGEEGIWRNHSARWRHTR
jgi:hypothetical protein